MKDGIKIGDKVWSMKFWSTSGVEECNVTDDTSHNNYCYTTPIGMSPQNVRRFEKIGGTVFASRDDAVAAAKKKRDAMVKTLRKKLERLEAEGFSPTERTPE